jgi:superfamily I DNA/RNA helicase
VNGWQEARNAAQTARTLVADDTATAQFVVDKALAKAGLRCVLLRPSDPLLSGAHAILDREAETVWVRGDATSGDRTVYVAHELAHFYLHSQTVCQCSAHDFAESDAVIPVGYSPRERRETEANEFARELLLPARVAHTLFHEQGLDAHALAARFGLPVAIVFAQLGDVTATSAPAPENAPVAEEAPIPVPVPGETVFLDESQRAAAFAPFGPLLVGAGPGTGKTRTLTARVLHLLEQGVNAQNILCLTFSRKAAEEMRQRIGVANRDAAGQMSVSTFHAYGLDLLRRHGAVLNLPPVPVLLTDAEACALLERRAAQLNLSALRYLHDLAFPLPDVLRTINKAKEDLLTPETFMAQAERVGDERLVEVARVFEVYEALLREKGAVDYPDLVVRALRLLQEFSPVCQAEQAQWHHILVDEYQDINRASAKLVQTLAGDGRGLWCVGDLRQAIYRFRGASPANVTHFLTDFPHGKRADLQVNYRSRPHLVQLFGAASGEGVSAWQAHRPDPNQAESENLPDKTALSTLAPAVFALASDDRAQAQGIAETMRRFHANGYTWRDQVVLCRTNTQIRQLRAALALHGIPVVPGQDEVGLLRQPDVRRLLNALARACEPHGPARRVLPDLPPGLPFRGEAADFFAELLWGKPGWARQIQDRGAVARLLTLARAFRDRAQTVRETDEPRQAFLRHLRRMVRMRASFGELEETGEGPDAIRLLTVHGAKGLEFPIVFVPNLSQGKFPSAAPPQLLPEIKDDIDANPNDEERRLFFVALTRAREHLVLSRAVKYNNRAAAPSILLRELGGPKVLTHLKQVEWGEPGVISPSPTVTEMDEIQDAPGVEVAAPVEAGDAELYMRCPRRYFYERVADLAAGERTLYGAFKRSVEEALSQPDPVTALEEAWEASGPDPAHPHAPLYREAADQIVRRSAGGNRGAGARLASRRVPAPHNPQPLLVHLEGGGIVAVRPDAIVESENETVWEVQSFRRAPSGPIEAPMDEPRLSLLQEAQFQKAGSQPVSVAFHYLQTGQLLPVPDRPRKRATHLSQYARAVQGIQLQVFRPAPADSRDCCACPYFFVCPE